MDTLNVRKNGDQTHLVGKKWNMIPKKENAYSNLAIFGQDIEWYYALCVTFYTYNSFLCQLSSWSFVGIGQMLDICYKNMWKFTKKIDVWKSYFPSLVDPQLMIMPSYKRVKCFDLVFQSV